MKNILIIFCLMTFYTHFLKARETSEAMSEMTNNFTTIIKNIDDEYATAESKNASTRLYHDETAINVTPEIGIKVPGLVGFSFNVGVEYTFKKSLPAGFVYNKP